MAGLYQLLADVLIFSLTVCGGGSHHKASPAVLVQVRVKIGDPEIVCIADLFVLVDSRHSKRQPPGTLGRLCLYLVHVKGRVRHHKIAAAVQVMGIVVEGVGLIAGLDNTG